MKLYCLLLIALLGAEQTFAVLTDFSWKNMDAFMTGDLRYRMMKKIPTRRRYCDCHEIDPADNYPVCASNKAYYENACLFKCSKMRSPHLEVADMAACGPETFKVFKQGEFLSHY